jgi:hypothetical protein
MGVAPDEIGGAKVVCYAIIGERHRPTGSYEQTVAGVAQGPAKAMAICQYAGESSYYLFGCNAAWEPITDTWHRTLEEAKAQADFEYAGVSAAWQ